MLTKGAREHHGHHLVTITNEPQGTGHWFCNRHFWTCLSAPWRSPRFGSRCVLTGREPRPERPGGWPHQPGLSGINLVPVFSVLTCPCSRVTVPKPVSTSAALTGDGSGDSLILIGTLWVAVTQLQRYHRARSAALLMVSTAKTTGAPSYLSDGLNLVGPSG